VAKREGLAPELITDLARAVLDAHRQAPRRDFDAAAALDGIIRENATSFEESPELFAPNRVGALTRASLLWLERSKGLLLDRRQAGKVRRCHGDLHLRNIVLLGDKPVLFDALEFDEALATTDILYDLAFLIMDLWERGFAEAANAVTNQYLRGSDESELAGLRAFPLMLSVRAAIRAKVVAASLANLEGAGQQEARAEALRYFALAERCLRAAPPRLVAIGGLSGTGKTTIARALAPFLEPLPGAVHLRTDVERKLLLAAAETERLPQSGYAPEISAKVYERVADKARLALKAGYCVIADAVHGSLRERDGAEAAARAAGAPFAGIWLEAALQKRVARVETRHHDASDATPDFVRRQASFDLGAIAWHRIDAEGAPAEVLARVLAALGLEGSKGPSVPL
jgi:predicted kinase